MDTIEQLLHGGWSLSVWHTCDGAIGAELWHKGVTVTDVGTTVAEAVDNVTRKLLASQEPSQAPPAGEKEA